MLPNRTITNKVCMIILNFEVINVNRLIKFFNLMLLDKQVLAVYADKFISY